MIQNLLTRIKAIGTQPPRPPALDRIVNTSVASRWGAIMRRGDWTPQKIEDALNGAVCGNVELQFELFTLMEDTWPMLRKCLNEVKRAIACAPWQVQAWAPKGGKPSARAQEKADHLDNVIWHMRPDPARKENAFEDMLYDCCDAIGKGISVQEILWELRSGLLVPRATQWLPNRFYGSTYQEPGLLQLNRLGQGQDYEPFSSYPDQFLIATYKGATATTAQEQGLLRPLAFFWAAANFSAEFMLRNAELFGVPVRIAKYDHTQPGLGELVGEMLANMGSTGWGAFPQSTQLELHESSGGSQNPAERMMSIADTACQIVVLGQTLTTDVSANGGSRALGNTHSAVRADVIKSGADWVANTLNLQLVPAIMRAVYGDNHEDPWLQPATDEGKDLLQQAQRDEILFTKIGLPVAKAYLYEAHGVPAPAAGDDLLIPTKPTSSSTPHTMNPRPQNPASDELNASRPSANGGVSTGVSQQDLLNNIMESLTGINRRWLSPLRPVFHTLMSKALDKNITDEDFITAVEEARDRMPAIELDATELRDALIGVMGASALNGALSAAISHSSAQPQTPE